jgi:hypothetical protein
VPIIDARDLDLSSSGKADALPVHIITVEPATSSLLSRSIASLRARA